MLHLLRVLRSLRVIRVFGVIGFAGTTLHAQARVTSPDGRNHVTVEVREGKLYYSLSRDGRALLLPSQLGVE